MLQAKPIYLQYGAETVRDKDSTNGEVKQTAKKRKKGDAGKVSVKERSKREDKEQKKASSSKDKDCEEKNKVNIPWLKLFMEWFSLTIWWFWVPFQLYRKGRCWLGIMP